MPRRVFISLLLGCWVAGCGPQAPDTAGRGAVASRPSTFGYQQDVQAVLEAEGRQTYAICCIGCHGAAGDGQGEAAVFLYPKPRNFQLADFKFSSRRSGQLPMDGDLKRTIRNGLKGSAMPSFALLPDRQIDALIAYLKTFSPRWKEETPGAAIPTMDDPYAADADKSSAIHRGEAVYHGFATCWTCHPAYVSESDINKYLQSFGNEPRVGFRPNLNLSEGKTNTQGDMVYPPDFRRDFVRSGTQVTDLYRSIAAGITGTAMPTWIDSMHLAGRTPDAAPLVEPADIWAVAYYVQDLIGRRPAKVAEADAVIRDRPKKIYLHGPPPPPAPTTQESQPEDVKFEEF